MRCPKVLITVRSELLASHPDYRRHFIPVESQNKERDEEDEAAIQKLFKKWSGGRAMTDEEMEHVREALKQVPHDA